MLNLVIQIYSNLSSNIIFNCLLDLTGVGRKFKSSKAFPSSLTSAWAQLHTQHHPPIFHPSQPRESSVEEPFPHVSSMLSNKHRRPFGLRPSQGAFFEESRAGHTYFVRKQPAGWVWKPTFNSIFLEWSALRVHVTDSYPSSFLFIPCVLLISKLHKRI